MTNNILAEAWKSYADLPGVAAERDEFSKALGEAMADNNRLREVNRELVAALDDLLTYDRVERPAFRTWPEGAPHSTVRIRQEKLIELEDRATAALAKAKETAP